MKGGIILSGAIEKYKERNNRYPANIEGLPPEYLNEGDLPYEVKRFNYLLTETDTTYRLEFFVTSDYVLLWDKDRRTWVE